MAELRVEIPKELEDDIRGLPDIEVSMFVTRVVKGEFDRLARLKRIVAKSKLTEKDVEELSDKVEKPLSKRFRQSVGR